MKLAFALLLVVAALMAAGAAQADGWCGESSDAACQVGMAYVECVDGTVWLLDPALVDVDTFGETMCEGGYTVLEPPPATPPDAPGPDGGPQWDPGGTDVGFAADPNMDPDPSLYGTEVQCPDGSIWAVAIGDRFVCPLPT
ncbi:MAG: hypothetical protein ACJ768_00350 [Gaiellaceae bacterium]